MMASEPELWRQCVRWLIDVGVLTTQHKAFQSHASMFDLAQTLRDGVVLCNLLNLIHPNSINLNHINMRPQMLQFLCMQNLRFVVNALYHVYGINPEELFHPSDLYNMTDFAKVLHTLSILSNIPDVAAKFRPFPGLIGPTALHYRPDVEEEDIYNSLADLASERDLVDEEENLYDSVAEEKEEGVYGSLIAVKRAPSVTKNKRSYCVTEVLETEGNYVQHLNMMKTKFLDPLASFPGITDKDITAIFMNLEELLPIHEDFLNSLKKHQNDRLSIPFIEFKNKFLIYGSYCSLMIDAQEYLDDLMKSSDKIRAFIEMCQDHASPSKFRLRELLCVPMQRILKYHLLVKELNKHTPDTSNDKAQLGTALEAMQELSHFVNEVKRDSEMQANITQVQSCLFNFSSHISLHTYGRLIKDGELKVKVGQQKSKVRNVFLFDQALFMTKEENGKYSLKDLLRLEDFAIEDIQLGRSKWSWSWWMRDKTRSVSYQVFAKTAIDKAKWIDQINTAFDNATPGALKERNTYNFKMHTFNEPSYCDGCKKLLLGTFFQGYYSSSHNAKSHKACLAETMKWIELSPGAGAAPSMDELSISSDQLAPSPAKKQKTVYKAHRDYKGQPPPPFPGANFICFETGEQIEVEEHHNTEWWTGYAMRNLEVKGLFPASFISPVQPGRGSKASSRVSYLDIQVLKDDGGNCPAEAVHFPTDHHSPVHLLPLNEYPWYAGKLDRDEAIRMLSGKPSGTFLVRTKEDSSGAVSLIFQNEIKHIKMHKTVDNLFYIAECKNFKTIQDLVGYYQENSMSSSFLGLETTLRLPYRDPTFFPPQRRPRPSISTRHSNPSPSAAGYIGKAVVLYDFTPRSDPELGLRAGQVVKIISKAGDSHGWWKGECAGQVGYFPATFIEECN